MASAKQRKPGTVKGKPMKAAPAAGAAKPKFGSPAWDAKYGVKRFTKKSAKGK
jgi:hypothetical protein